MATDHEKIEEIKKILKELPPWLNEDNGPFPGILEGVYRYRLSEIEKVIKADSTNLFEAVVDELKKGNYSCD